MMRPAFSSLQPPSSYEATGRRLQALIAAPGVQKVQAVTVCRLEHESPEDWKRLLEEIGETVGVRVETLDGGTARIGWREYCDA
jgi:phosphoribosylformimino-5-aminoimidazole carboxamide ribonucleotide (ProFAR) isomerase